MPLFNSTSFSFDSDFLLYVARCGGHSVFTDTELTAGNNLVVSLKNAGLWGKLFGFYPFMGRAPEPGTRNLISDSYPLTLTYDWAFSQYGARPDGYGAFADTGFTPLTGWPEYASGIRQGSFGFDLLQDNDSIYADHTVMTTEPGTGRDGASGVLLYMLSTTVSVSQPGWMNDGGGASSGISTTDATAIGVWISTWYNDPSSNAVALTHPDVTRKLYQNANALLSQTGKWYVPADSNGAFTKGGTLKIGGYGTTRAGANHVDNRPLGCAFFGLGLFPADVDNLTAIIAKFRTERLASPPAGLWIGDGDSIMQGFDSPFIFNAGGSLGFLAMIPPFTELTENNIITYAFGGGTAANIVASTYATGAHTKAGVATKYILWVGTNDIVAGSTAAAINASMRTLATMAKQDGFHVVVFTVLKRSDWAQGSANDLKRIDLNARTIADEGAYFDQVIDVEKAIDYSMLNGTYFGDPSGPPWIHPNEAGQELVWNYAAPLLR